MNKLLGLSLLLAVSAINAGEADVMAVNVLRSSDGSYRFAVTLRHGDEGWKHYANRWEIVAPDGQVIGVRTLHHPHVDEQAFTRSLSGVVAPPGVTTVSVRAYDSVHGGGGKEALVKLPQ